MEGRSWKEGADCKTLKGFVVYRLSNQEFVLSDFLRPCESCLAAVCFEDCFFFSPYYFYLLYICLGVFFFNRLLLVFSFRSFLFAGLLRGPELQQIPSGAVAS